MLLVGIFFFHEKGVAFKFGLVQHNMQNKLSNNLFAKHAKRENWLAWFGAKPHKVQKDKPKSASNKVH
jgi:hypothetical protein